MSEWELQCLREFLEEQDVFPRHDSNACMQDGVPLCVMAGSSDDWVDLTYMVGDYEEPADTNIDNQFRYGELEESLCTEETLVIIGDDEIIHKIYRQNIKVIRRA